jgi:hypothetical protein
MATSFINLTNPEAGTHVETDPYSYRRRRDPLFPHGEIDRAGIEGGTVRAWCGVEEPVKKGARGIPVRKREPEHCATCWDVRSHQSVIRL